MKNVYILLFFIASRLVVQAQDPLCNTTGQLSGADETNIQTNASPTGGCSYTVRVYFHLVRRSNGTGGQNSSVINTIMNNINSAYAPQGISFDNQGYDEIYNDSYFNLNPNDNNTYNSLTSTNFASNAINLYLLDDNGAFNGGLAKSIGAEALVVGGGYTPLGDSRQLVVPSLVVAHEIGHCLGLITHLQVFTVQN